MMKIFHSPASPFVRKVQVTALELGLGNRIELLKSAAHPVNRDSDIVAFNPTGQVPTLLTDEGEPLFDSRVICEYLDAMDGRGRIFPPSGTARWRALREQSVGDSLLDAALLVRYEKLIRPNDLIWEGWSNGQMQKIDSCLAVINAGSANFGSRFDIGTLTIACALGYLDFRFSSFDWRSAWPSAASWFEEVNKRASLQDTMPFDPNNR